jgi:hypothetical protein
MGHEVDQETILGLIKTLEIIPVRTSMFTGKQDPESIIIFLSGFHIACRIFGVKASEDRHLYATVEVARGWSPNTMPGPDILEQMRQRSFDNEAVISELINIEIDLLKRAYNLDI